MTEDDRERDRQLVVLARGGNEHAFEVLVRRHQDQTYRLALRMLGDRDDADDAAQEAFLQAWRGLESFRADAAFGTWLYRITMNECLRLLAGRRDTAELSVDIEDPGAGPEEMMAARQVVSAVKAGVAGLTPEQRAPWVLREVEGLTYEEIAEVLAVTVTAVKARLHRARLVIADAVRRAR